MSLPVGPPLRVPVPTPGFPACADSHTSELLAPPQAHQVGWHGRLGDVQGGRVGARVRVHVASSPSKKKNKFA